MSSFPSRCSYCNESDFGSVEGYERHVVTRHPDLPGYPGPADIELDKLKELKFLFQLFFVIPVGMDYSNDLVDAKEILVSMNY